MNTPITPLKGEILKDLSMGIVSMYSLSKLYINNV